MIIKVILLAIILVGIAFAAIAIKMFFIRGSEFKKACGTVDPKTGKPLPCTCKQPDHGNENHCHNEIMEDPSQDIL